MHRLVLLALVLATVAGCVDEAPTEAPEPASVVTDPTDYSYLENQTDGSGWHVHDYWRGEDSLVLVDLEQDLEFSCPGCSYVSYTRGASRLPSGTVVPQGASQVNITVSWDFDGDHPLPELFVKSAADSEARSLGPVENREQVVFNSTNEMNDPPHQSLSGWGFYVKFTGTDEDPYEFSGTIRMHVEAVRGLDIPAWPPHPDLWQGQDRLSLFEDEEGMALYREQHGSGWVCYGVCDMGRHAPGDGIVVPFDASHVEVHLSYGPGLPTGLGLRHHGADAWEMTTSDPDTTEPGSATFVIPVDHAKGDSPYAKQSLWEFEMYIQDQPVDPARWSGSYTLSAWAVKA